jgi:glycosyltransferase involved in cell wall biosynthesis
VKKVLVTPRWYTYGEQLILPFQLMKEKFDLIHYPHFNSPILFPGKSVCTIHDVTPFYFPGHKMKSKLRQLGYRAVFNATVRKASQIITVSQSTKAGIIDLFNVAPDKIKITYEGVDERFKLMDKSGIIESMKKQYGIEPPFLFYVGVWRNHKNLEKLISAFEKLKEKYQIPHTLVLAGQEDPHYPNIRQKINSSPVKNAIITPGFIAGDDLPKLYNLAELFVIPSLIEGFGLVAIEAQCCGCPVAASNITSLPEILDHSAAQFDPKNVDDIAEKIYNVLSNVSYKEQLVTSGLKNCERFSWSKCARETLAIYQSVIQTKNENSKQKNHDQGE